MKLSLEALARDDLGGDLARDDAAEDAAHESSTGSPTAIAPASATLAYMPTF